MKHVSTYLALPYSHSHERSILTLKSGCGLNLFRIARVLASHDCVKSGTGFDIDLKLVIFQLMINAMGAGVWECIQLERLRKLRYMDAVTCLFVSI